MFDSKRYCRCLLAPYPTGGPTLWLTPQSRQGKVCTSSPAPHHILAIISCQTGKEAEGEVKTHTTW